MRRRRRWRGGGTFETGEDGRARVGWRRRTPGGAPAKKAKSGVGGGGERGEGGGTAVTDGARRTVTAEAESLKSERLALALSLASWGRQAFVNRGGVVCVCARGGWWRWGRVSYEDSDGGEEQRRRRAGRRRWQRTEQRVAVAAESWRVYSKEDLNIPSRSWRAQGKGGILRRMWYTSEES